MNIFRKIWNSTGDGCKLGGVISENLEGGEVIRQAPSVGVVWIFSGTTHMNVKLHESEAL